VKQGGHDVPRAVVKERYSRTPALLPRAIEYSTRAYHFDNSGKKNRLVAEYENGRLVSAVIDPPVWLANSMAGASRRTRKKR
jgi:predicted ABC-type ATPase